MPGPSTPRRGIVPPARILLLAIVAFCVAIGGSLADPSPVAAAGPKVVVVVGPTHGATAKYLTRARAIAAQARSLGASVTEIYTPRATWARVVAAARGAKLFVYLGHGNGWPSPYTFNPTKVNGLGLNPTLGSGTTKPVKYYGEALVARSIKLAPGAVVLLNHLCYASGSPEPGRAQPSWSVARRRVDNYARGFLAAGAGAVIADAYTDVRYTVRAILSGRNILAAWRADPNHHGNERSFASRTSGFRNYLDPSRPSSYFHRALTTKPGFSPAAATKAVVAAPLRATTLTGAKLRLKPAESARVITTIKKGTSLAVAGPLFNDARGRTWAPVRTAAGKAGYVAAWLLRFGGTARPKVNVLLRASPSLTGKKIETVGALKRLTVLRSRKDGALRVWLNVRTSTGRTGWVAGWLSRP
jgi:hypothetical protein